MYLAIPIGRLRDHADPLLYGPAQGHLDRAATVCVGDPPDAVVVEDTLGPTGRAPRLRVDPVLRHESSQLLTGQGGRALDLVQHRPTARLVVQHLQLVDGEVGDTGRTDDPVVDEGEHGPPGLERETQTRAGPVDEEQVDAAHPESTRGLARRR